MTEPTSAQDLFKGRHFDQEIIVLCIRWYLTFKLSSRDLVQMMAERGITLSHTTILRWVQQYVPEFEKRWNHYARPVGDSWRVDETYVKVKANGSAASCLAERRKSRVAPEESTARYR
jgi:transposase-like protein